MNAHMVRHSQYRRREIQYALDAGVDELIRDILRFNGRHGNDADPDIACRLSFPSASSIGSTVKPVDRRCRPWRMGVEHRRNLHIVLQIRVIVAQRAARDCPRRQAPR